METGGVSSRKSATCKFILARGHLVLTTRGTFKAQKFFKQKVFLCFLRFFCKFRRFVKVMLILPKQARFGDLPRNVSRCISVCTRFRYLSGEGVSVSTFGCLSGKTTKLNSPFSSEQVFKLRNVCPLSTKAENYVKKG